MTTLPGSETARAAPAPTDARAELSRAARRSARLEPLLNPRSVAVVGASNNPSFVSSILKNLTRYGFTGPVVAVNPRYSSVHGAPCYATLEEIPHPIDLVVVGISHRFIPALLEQCQRKGVGALEVVSSGFAEMGAEGALRQAELSRWAQQTGIPVGGPNCLGLLNALSGAVALPTVFEKMIPGVVGAVLQSGMMAPSMLVPLISRDIGLTVAITTGNEADVDAADYIDYLVDHQATRVIACFTEQIKSPERFVQACERAADHQKPIVMLKIGRSEAGRRAALAHTGSLVGVDAVTDVVLRKLGVTRVSSVDELLEAVAVFHTRKLPRGRGVAPIIVSGGAAGLLSDLAASSGVTLPALPEHTERALTAVVPEFGNVGNPLDVTGQGVFQTDILSGAIDLLAESGVLDVIVYCRGFPSRLDRQTPVGEILEQAVARHPEVLFLVLGLAGGHLHASQYPDQPTVEPIVHLDGIPFLQGSEYGLRAIGALLRYAEFQRQRQRRAGAAEARRSDDQAAERARALLRAAEGRTLGERESKQILALYGIPVARERSTRSAEEAVAAAAELGYPVVLKVESPDLPHKTEVDAVMLDLRSPEAVAQGFEQIVARARRAAPQAVLQGVLVQEMVEAGVEVIVGMQRDPQFGPVIACGFGGVLVEVLDDVQLMLPPVDLTEARAALERLRGRPILTGARGRTPADVEALVDTVVRFSELCDDVGDLLEAIDVNPLIVLGEGRGVRAVDALVVPRAAEQARVSSASAHPAAGDS